MKQQQFGTYANFKINYFPDLTIQIPEEGGGAMQAFGLISLVGLAWLLQFALTWFQIRHYRAMMRKMVTEHQDSEGFYLFSGVARKAMGSGAIVLIIVDSQSVVRNCQVLSGLTVFAKFKPHFGYVGMRLEKVIEIADVTLSKKRGLSSRKQSMAKAFQMAAENATRSLTNPVSVPQ